MKTYSPWLVAVLAAAVTAGACSKADSATTKKIDDLAARVDKLEATLAGFAEVEGFVRPIMEQQQAQRAQQEAAEPDPTARFAVDITGDIVDGPAGAAVTIIEAWDFA